MLFTQRTFKDHGYSINVKDLNVKEFTPAAVVADKAIQISWTTEKHKMSINLYGKEIDEFLAVLNSIQKT